MSLFVLYRSQRRYLGERLSRHVIRVRMKHDYREGRNAFATGCDRLQDLGQFAKKAQVIHTQQRAGDELTKGFGRLDLNVNLGRVLSNNHCLELVGFDFKYPACILRDDRIVREREAEYGM